MRCDLYFCKPVLFHVLPNSQNRHGCVYVDQLNDTLNGGTKRLRAEVMGLQDLGHTQALFLGVPLFLTRDCLYGTSTAQSQHVPHHCVKAP